MARQGYRPHRRMRARRLAGDVLESPADECKGFGAAAPPLAVQKAAWTALKDDPESTDAA
jgi:hypothetical protein